MTVVVGVIFTRLQTQLGAFYIAFFAAAPSLLGASCVFAAKVGEIGGAGYRLALIVHGDHCHAGHISKGVLYSLEHFNVYKVG